MKIYVQVACEFDPDLNPRVDRRTGEVRAEPGDQLMRVWPLGRLGISRAMQLKGAEVTAFALGPEHEPALRYALAAGARRAVAVLCNPDKLPTQTLSRWLEEEKPDLVIADRLAGGLAWLAGWSHLGALSDLELREGRLLAVRHLGRGHRQRVSAALPAAVRLAPSPPPYISRTRLKAVADKTIETFELEGEAAAGVEVGPLQPARARTRGAQKNAKSSKASDRVKALMGLAAPATPATPAPTEDVSQTPDSMAEEFVRYLKHHQLLNKEDPRVAVS